MEAKGIKAFPEGKAISPGSRCSAGVKRKEIPREKDVALDRLEKWTRMALLVETEIAWSSCFDRALETLPVHSEKLGCRTIDLIHIAIAAQLDVDTFVTCDERQAKAAKAEGLKTELLRF
jgi:predicted nucleic acid-binding protein